MDSAEFGLSPPPWDIPVASPQMFTDRVETLRVPHSSLVKVQTRTQVFTVFSQSSPDCSRSTRNFLGKYKELPGSWRPAFFYMKNLKNVTDN